MAPFIRGDLAPGEARAAELDTSPLHAHRVKSADDPLFAAAYAILWEEFGAAGEVESRAVLAKRLAETDSPRKYELIAITRDDEVVAVRDHQAIAGEGASDGASGHASDSGVVVHLSHAWIRPDFRRTGLAGWLRALPVQLARTLAPFATSPITLVAEMEHPDVGYPQRMIRLAAYEKAGFRKVDPATFSFLQPDFRPPAEIDASAGPQPLPMGLIVRCVGREKEPSMTGAALRDMVTALYRMYALDFRAKDMAVVWDHLELAAPAEDAVIPLVPPTK